MLYQDQNNETLVMLTLAGEQRAYEVLVVRYEKAVIASANSVTHNLFMAQDAAQDAFITAWMKLDLLREPEKYGAWVCRIAKNCAKNMVVRFRSFLDIEDYGHCLSSLESRDDPEAAYELTEEKELLHESIGKLPQKVREIIHLHYFEGLSIAEIADRMFIAEGTVKWQLHEGRKRLRKDLCAMNEEYSDTLVQRVMKKVEELKLWQFKNSKTGFEKVYKDVLSEVEELPESTDKYHAMADVLMRGWWWLKGEKNDALFARIREAAEKGKNDEVMEFIVGIEDEKLYGSNKIEFIRDKQIPRLEAGGFQKALAAEWFWLGFAYKYSDIEKSLEALNKTLSVAKHFDLYYAYALAEIEKVKMLSDTYRHKNENNYSLLSLALEYRMEEGELRHWSIQSDRDGNLYSIDMDIDAIFRHASLCDGLFTVKGLPLGDVYTGSDGTTLTFEADSVTVQTPAGQFDNCQLWVTKQQSDTYRTYYKEGIGIVKQERKFNGFSEMRMLKACDIKGGKGIIPIAAGNTWEYTADYNPYVMLQNTRYTMQYADEKIVTVYCVSTIERLKYDDNSWEDMIKQIRNEYCRELNGKYEICDVTYPISRAELLASTPVEKAHTKAACSAARRIMETDPQFNPDRTETGHWNFFQRLPVEIHDGRITVQDDPRWSFEWKHNGGNENDPGYPLLNNDIYNILQDATECIWCDDWKPETNHITEHIVDFFLWGTHPVKTKICCENIGSVTVKAGTFENCLRLTTETSGLEQVFGLQYRGGKREYFFAPTIGIVKVINHSPDNDRQSVYELTEYKVTGEGYMPVKDGMLRRYDALGLTDGYEASALYTYAQDNDGQLYIFEDRRGVRKVTPKITQYRFIAAEIEEEELLRVGKHEEAKLQYDLNNFNLLTHILGRPARYWYAPERCTAQAKYRIAICELLAEGGEIPPAWLGIYALSHFHASCSLIGSGNIEEGYRYMERAFELYPNWWKLPKGEPLDVGSRLIFGGIKVVKDKGMIELPDGTRQHIQYDWLFKHNSGEMYYALTTRNGWEWFDGERNEERFKKAAERAKELMESAD